MSSVFKQLKDTFSGFGSGLTTEARENAKRALRDWLAVNAATLQSKRGADFNGTMMQYFHWYLPPDGSHWNRVKDESKALADAGITALWLPRPTKALGVAMMWATECMTSLI